MTKPATKLDEVLALAPIAWRELGIEQLNAPDAETLINELDNLATSAARLSAYLSSIRLGLPHKVAVAHQNSVATKVRKALGFSYARDPIIF